MDLLKNAGLYAEDHATGKDGFNLAAVMLLGRDEVIRDVSPAYQTDALVRKVNVDRYDDRLTVVTNLIESFEQLFKFATLHLPDKFYVEGAERKSLRNIGYSEKLGSGARKMFKYGRLYSGADPEFIEDDVFRIIQPLNENYSYDVEIENVSRDSKTTQKTTQKILSELDSTEFILKQIARNPYITRRKLSESVSMAASAVQKHIEKLKSSGRITRIGGDRGGHWEVRE